jgi:hypothetical protein
MELILSIRAEVKPMLYETACKLSCEKLLYPQMMRKKKTSTGFFIMKNYKGCQQR